MNKLIAACTLLFSLLCMHGVRAFEHVTVVPDEANWHPVYELFDADLQARLQARIDANPEWRRLARSKRLAIAVIDLGSETPRFARINGNEMMYSASLPKIAILFAAYAAIDDGELEETDDLHRDLAAMIRRSDNQAATRVIDRIGLSKIESALTDPRYQLYDTSRGGGLWVGKRYAKQGQRKGDPLHGISHGATATQVARFYYLLANGRLISPQRSEQMLADLVDPALNHKFVGVLKDRQPKARLYRKSGTWRNFHSDSVLVRGPEWRNYILVAITESDNGSKVVSGLVGAVEEILNDS